jgi:alpha-amylase
VGTWFIEFAQLDGFRLDAVKHIPASFYKWWLARCARNTRAASCSPSANTGAATSASCRVPRGHRRAMRLFDVPLHFKLLEASQKGRDYDLTKIFDGRSSKRTR